MDFFSQRAIFSRSNSVPNEIQGRFTTDCSGIRILCLRPDSLLRAYLLCVQQNKRSDLQKMPAEIGCPWKKMVLRVHNKYSSIVHVIICKLSYGSQYYFCNSKLELEEQENTSAESIHLKYLVNNNHNLPKKQEKKSSFIFLQSHLTHFQSLLLPFCFLFFSLSFSFHFFHSFSLPSFSHSLVLILT